MIKITMRKLILLSAIASVAIIIILLFVFSSERKQKSDEAYNKAFAKKYKILTPSFPDSMSFAGEIVPLNNILVREYFDRELTINTFWHTNTILSIKRANRWFPVIEPILKENNIPDDFKYLALIESGLMNVVSPKGATGFWQFIEETGKIYGLEINKEVDERYHVEKSTHAACNYLKESFNEFKSWTLVAAAYNAGKRRISETIEKQKNNNYYDLLFNEETSRYVFRIVALKNIYENPAKYGFYIRESDLYPEIPVNEMSISTPVPDFVSFAKENGISYKVLKEFNPWLRAEHLTNLSGKTYIIKLPKDNDLRYDELTKRNDENFKIFNDTIRVDEIY
jgi:membrane-bound lytic murein transglycosylase D